MKIFEKGDKVADSELIENGYSIVAHFNDTIYWFGNYRWLRVAYGVVTEVILGGY